MQYTTNYNLNKPETTDRRQISNRNSNMDIIDSQMKANADNIKDLQTEVSNNQIEALYLDVDYNDVYGVEIDMVNNVFTRLSASVGKTAGTDFDTTTTFGGRKRCNLTDDGFVTGYYGDASYTETGALTQAVGSHPIGTHVQVMVEQPKFYYKVVPVLLEKIVNGKGYHMRKAKYYVSDTYRLGFKVHPAFIVNGVEKDYIYLSAYEGTIYDTSGSSYLLNDEQIADFTATTGDKLCSIANAKPCSGLTQNLTRANTRKLAQNRGTGWKQSYQVSVSMSQLLMLIEYAQFNMQSAIGNGAVSKTDDGLTNQAESTGGTTSLGNTSGAVTNTNGIQIVSYRGEENFWGNIWKWVDGINVYANNEQSIYVADNGFTDNVSTSPYSDVGFTGAKSDGYISAFGYSDSFDWLFFPSETLGDSSLPVSDYHWLNSQANSWFVTVLGGRWNTGLTAGAFGLAMTYSSTIHYRTIGGRLVYVG